MYLLDTNAIIYYLKDDARVVPSLREIFEEDVQIFISSITELELFSFSDLSSRESESIEKILSTLSIIPIDSQIARLGGFLRSRHRLKTSDSVIAATALFTNSTLLTRNIRDFKNIPQLKLRAI